MILEWNVIEECERQGQIGLFSCLLHYIFSFYRERESKENSDSVIYKFFKIRKETMYLNKNMDVFHLLNLSGFSRQTGIVVLYV